MPQPQVRSAKRATLIRFNPVGAGLALIGAALSAAPPATAQTADPASVVAAERAFAADAPRLGIAGSFNVWAAPDAVVIGASGVEPVSVAYPLPASPPGNEPHLTWWPTFAGIARSGDLGFTTGAVEVAGKRSGHYFTIWRRQPDGAWRWVYDGGSAASAIDAPGPETEPAVLEISREASISPGRAFEAALAVERKLADAARIDQRAAHLEFAGHGARFHVASLPPATDPATISEALKSWPASFQFGSAEGGGASDAGDLVWTHGPVEWTQDGKPGRGHYVRIWQRQAAGWRLVFAQLITRSVPEAVPPDPADVHAPGA